MISNFKHLQNAPFLPHPSIPPHTTPFHSPAEDESGSDANDVELLEKAKRKLHHKQL